MCIETGRRMFVAAHILMETWEQYVKQLVGSVPGLYIHSCERLKISLHRLEKRVISWYGLSSDHPGDVQEQISSRTSSGGSHGGINEARPRLLPAFSMRSGSSMGCLRTVSQVGLLTLMHPLIGEPSDRKKGGGSEQVS
jgi:hypothetical protein